MSLYQTLVVALDTSDEAAEVLATAASLVKGSDARIEIIHATERPLIAYGAMTTAAVAIPSEMEIKESLFPGLAAKVEAAGFSRENLHIRFGRAADVIVGLADEVEADVIVIGSHGRHGVKLLLGSTANAVLHQARCDVLAVRVSSD
jgi:universal stress protein A